jgi:hypothetical protein
MTTITVVSNISPLSSFATHDKVVNLKNETVELISSVNPIVSMAVVPKKQTVEIESFVSSINIIVTTIGNKPKQETREITTYTSQIQTFVDLLIPSNSLTPNAYLNVIEGGSRAYNIQNLSNVYSIDNPSYCEVIK